MWNALKTKLFRLFGSKVSKSEFVRLAQEQGYMSEEQAAEATELLSNGGDPEATSQDILVDNGLLTESQAEVIAISRKSVAPGEHLSEQFKSANRAVQDTGAMHLSEVAQAIAAKKGGGD